MKRLGSVSAVVLFAALAGCGVLPEPSPPPELYRLTTVDHTAVPGRRLPVQLVVNRPVAEAALDTQRLALTRSPTTLDYFADSAWTDQLPGMVQAQLIASLENSGRFAAVGTPTGALHADEVLALDLRHFEAVYHGAGPPRWRVEIAAQLIRMPNRTALAVRDFQAEVPAARNAMPDIVAAADAAWRNVAREIVAWTVESLATRH